VDRRNHQENSGKPEKREAELTKNHGKSITVPYSAKPIEFPIALRRSPMPNNSTSPTAPSHCRILLLEDDQGFSQLLAENLPQNRFQITSVSNGVDGLKQIMAQDFDIVLCDMMMPTLPGDKFYIAVERTKPQLCKRFIFMTGHRSDPKWDAFVRKIGGVLLWKPFQIHELNAAIDLVLKKSGAK
jgi:CheY-like chemotaxis protein